MSNLPAERVPLIGREAELGTLADRMRATPGRLITITGPGGVGKTSLAVAVARQLTPSFADGVWLADLAALKSPHAAPHAIAQAVGVREGSGTDVAGNLTTFLRDRRLLLLMDNCEHLIDVCAALTDDLLDNCPTLFILATSREPLRIAGEVTFPLRPLPVPQAATVTDFDGLRSCASVVLFVDRAQAAQPEFTLTAENAQTVAEICTRLDGIPLALELAATRVAGLPLEQIAERLRGSFALLIGNGRRRPERHQTLRATLEWSHQLLSPAEQALFRRLGAFAGSWTMSAAESVCAGAGVAASDIGDLLAGLVEKSLVGLEAVDGETRYRFLAPVHEYAQGQLAASGESDVIRNRHCDFYVREAERARPELHRAEQAGWLRRLDRDFDNLRTAIKTAHDRADSERALRLAGALWWYLWVRGYLREGVRWLEPAIGSSEVSAQARLAGLGAATMLLGALGRSHEATAYADEMMALANQVGDRAEVARAATLLGLERLRSGDLAGTRPLFETALVHALAAGDPMMIAHARVNLGSVLPRAEAEDAEDLYRQGLAEFEAVGDQWGIAYAANNLATLLRERGEPATAAGLSARAVRLLANLGDRFYLIFAVEDLARALPAVPRGETVACLFGAAHGLRQATGALLSPGSREEYERGVAAVRRDLGEVAFAAAWAAGMRRPLDDLVNEAMAPETRARGSQGPGGEAALAGPAGALTPREREVACLIGQGYSNRQIADELVITVGTAGIHVEHILRKLELRSRHQVATWARAHGLVTD